MILVVSFANRLGHGASQNSLLKLLQISGLVFPLLFVSVYLSNKRLRKSLRDSEKSESLTIDEDYTRGQYVIEGTEAGTWDWNIQTGELIINERWAEIIGYTIEELEPIGFDTWKRITHPEDAELAKAKLDEHSEGKLSYYDVQFRQMHKDGRWRWVNARGKILEWTSDSKPLRMSGTHLDVTEQKQAELELEESRRMLQHVLDTIPVRVFWKDTRSVFLGCNQLLADDLGQKCSSDLVGRTDFDFFSNEEAERFQYDDQQVMRSGKDKIAYEEPLKPPNGQIIWLRTSKVPLRDPDGNIIGVLGTYEDITSRKKTEQELIQAKDDAEAASKAKDDFLAIMSHEMRTPLNPILGFSDILLESCTTEPERSYIETIRSSGYRQLDLIDDILHYMRINSDKVEPRLETVDLVTLCEKSVQEMLPDANGLRLTFENCLGSLDAPTDLEVETDMLMLRRILDNLISNALKYTTEGYVTLRLSMEPSTPPLFQFEVQDSGIGITESHQRMLFEPFSQVDSSYTREHEGLGLGLAICKKLTTLLNGTISVRSTRGEGSTFTVRIPLEITKNTRKNSAVAPYGQTSRNRFSRPSQILIVDDKPDNIAIAKAFVESFNGTTEAAGNGKEAIERCQQKKFDIILMDLSMPVMDGAQAAKWIRSHPNPNQGAPIVAVTANVTHDVKQVCTAAGMNAYISKPLNSHEFFETLNNLL
mgnify:CR=1 FL=1